MTLEINQDNLAKSQTLLRKINQTVDRLRVKEIGKPGSEERVTTWIGQPVKPVATDTTTPQE